MRIVSAGIDTTSFEGAPAAGERALMRSVLEDAIQCLGGSVGPARERRQLAAEARAWFVAEDARWPFAFESICEALDLSAERLRGQLLRHAPSMPLVNEAPPPAPAPSRRNLPTEQEIVRMIREGQPLRVVAETFGISVSKASILSCGLASRIKAERDEEIRRMRRSGWTHRALATQFGLSRIRIMRICARRDLVEIERPSAAA
jgi:hypothetical protein